MFYCLYIFQVINLSSLSTLSDFLFVMREGPSGRGFSCNAYLTFIYLIVNVSSGPKLIKLRLETSLKSQASDWLKWRLDSDFLKTKQVCEVSVHTYFSFQTLKNVFIEINDKGTLKAHEHDKYENIAGSV
jgi:hypothetical protein